MKIHAFLVISDTGVLKVVKNRPALSNDEIALTLALDIPDVFLNRLMPTATIVIPEDAITSISPEVAVSIAALQVSDSLKLDIQKVEDGLMDMVVENMKTKQEGGSR